MLKTKYAERNYKTKYVINYFVLLFCFVIFTFCVIQDAERKNNASGCRSNFAKYFLCSITMDTVSTFLLVQFHALHE